MNSMTQEVLQAWENRQGPVVVATVAADGSPNIIYATCVGKFAADTLVVADNYFHKTKENATGTNHHGAILFQTKDGKAYQVKGILQYHTSGEIFDFMKSWNPVKHPGHAALALRVEQVFSGAKIIC